MKICIIGAPSTGKSSFARSVAAELTKHGQSCELIQEYATHYIQHAGAPAHPWEQLMIAVGQHQAEEEATRDFIVCDAAAFVTYIYAQRAIPKQVTDHEWPKYRHLMDQLRQLARTSANSYNLIFLLSHVFPPRNDGIRHDDHLSRQTCQDINRQIEEYLQSEKVHYHKLKANDSKALPQALHLISQRAITSPTQEKSSIKSEA